MSIFSKLFGSKGTGKLAYPPTFYVFGLQGPAFGQPQGDLMPEKAKALMDGYAPAANMQLKLVRPAEWGGKINASSSGGVITTSINLKDHQPAIRSYLHRQGLKADAIDRAFAASEAEGLILTNPFSGITVIGVPVE